MASAADVRPRVFWQAVCTCGHERGYHTNNGTGGCAGRAADGKANPCQGGCSAFEAVPTGIRMKEMYGEAPVGNPAALVGKKVRHKDIPDVVGLCTNVFSFSEESNPMCRCEFDIPDERRPGRLRKIYGLHYAGNLEEVPDGD